MNTSIAQLLSHRTAEHAYFIRTPAQEPREQSKQQTLQAIVNVSIRPLSQLFIVLVLGPLVNRPLELLLHHINKPSLFKKVLVLGSKVNSSSCFSAGLDAEKTGAEDFAVWGKSSVIAGDGVS